MALVKVVMREASIAEGPHMTPKGLRHSFGIHAIRSGVPLNLVQRWLGHASMTTTAIYLDALGEEEREIAARMWVTPVSPIPSSAPQPEHVRETIWLGRELGISTTVRRRLFTHKSGRSDWARL